MQEHKDSVFDLDRCVPKKRDDIVWADIVKEDNEALARGEVVVEEVSESLDEMIDRWILNRQFPSMTPGIAARYRQRMKILHKEGRI